jgi:hypothetical protein
VSNGSRGITSFPEETAPEELTPEQEAEAPIPFRKFEHD